MRRLVTPADYDRVYDIYMHETVVPFLGFDPMPREAFSKVFDPLFESGCFYLYEVDGEVMGFWNAGKLPPGNTLLAWVFPLHNADALGFAGRILWVVAGLVPGLLFISGLLFWWLKKRSKAALKAQ